MLIKPLILITGPTATGKTEIALEVAQHLPKVEIISADSRQIYRYMDIGTAKPTAEQQNQCPHHLLDVLNPEENYSAGAYERAARRIIEQVWNREGLPIMVGGTGLYWQSALDGCFEDDFTAALDETTEYAPIRAELQNRLHCEGLASLYEELGRRDPVAQARLQPGDTQRVLRALEVAMAGKSTLSVLWRERKGQPFVRKPQMICLIMERSRLYERIDQRVEQMVEQGWIEEVRALREMGYDPGDSALGTLGYFEMCSALAGHCLWKEAVERTKQRTRHLAKRQITWCRRDRRLRELDLDVWGKAGVVQRIVGEWEYRWGSGAS
ncbi:MAG: tRNA (adenosine(37)-N6)-dimethylallyltransferase MiaA [Gemmatimonadota bacterium]|nr:tRNA (adenosine(37)-N6)-dimethylallyltransferase MiaA [Gemmatimonadota bacterium]